MEADHSKIISSSKPREIISSTRRRSSKAARQLTYELLSKRSGFPWRIPYARLRFSGGSVRTDAAAHSGSQHRAADARRSAVASALRLPASSAVADGAAGSNGLQRAAAWHAR